MARAARSSAARATTPSATLPAESAVKSSAIPDGKDITALNQSVFRDVMKTTDFVKNLANANAEWVLVESIAMTASVILAVCMVPANSLGNATARKDGEASSVTKILITAHITNRVRMEPLAPTPAREATPAHADLVSLGPAVRLRSTNALATLAEMEEAALILKTPTAVRVPLVSMEETAN